MVPSLSYEHRRGGKVVSTGKQIMKGNKAHSVQYDSNGNKVSEVIWNIETGELLKEKVCISRKSIVSILKEMICCRR